MITNNDINTYLSLENPCTYLEMKIDLIKKQKDFFKLMNNAVFGKTIEMLENTEILNWSQQKEEVIWCQNQILTYKVFHENK